MAEYRVTFACLQKSTEFSAQNAAEVWVNVSRGGWRQLRSALPVSELRSHEGWTEWWWWWCHRGTCEPAPLAVTAFLTASRGPRYQTRCFPPRGALNGWQSSDPRKPTTFGSFALPVAPAFVPEWLCSRPLWGAGTDVLLLNTPPRCEPPPACGGSPTDRLSRLPNGRKQHQVTAFSDHNLKSFTFTLNPVGLINEIWFCSLTSELVSCSESSIRSQLRGTFLIRYCKNYVLDINCFFFVFWHIVA